MNQPLPIGSKERIMSIAKISGVSHVAGSTLDTPAAAAAASASRRPTVAPPPSVDEVTQQPLPPRFPWLSRLSQQLESASRRTPAFAPAPVLGDHVDKSA
jgi:hypothetical protein